MPKLTQKEIKVSVMKVITSELRLNCPFDLKDKIIEDLGADSLSLVEISMAIEEEFGIEIGNVDTEKFKTALDIITCVNEKLRA